MLYADIFAAVAEAQRTEPRPATLAYARRLIALLNPLTATLDPRQVIDALTDGIIAGCTDDAMYPAELNEDANAALTLPGFIVYVDKESRI